MKFLKWYSAILATIYLIGLIMLILGNYGGIFIFLLMLWIPVAYLSWSTIIKRVETKFLKWYSTFLLSIFVCFLLYGSLKAKESILILALILLSPMAIYFWRLAIQNND